MRHLALLIALVASPVAAAPKIESVVVKPNPAEFSGARPPEVEVSISLRRGKFDSGSCDARLEFGDGEARSVDFYLAATRTVRHVYKKGGRYTVSAKGAGKTPCEGAQRTALKVTGAPPEAKKAPAKKKGRREGAP
jgi:hypothetical protein